MTTKQILFLIGAIAAAVGPVLKEFASEMEGSTSTGRNSDNND